jgi:OOP family OmpA-OmpF porin
MRMNFGLLAATFAIAASAAAEVEPRYANARCENGKEARIAGTSTLHCNFKAGSARLEDDPNCIPQIEPVLRDLLSFKDVSIMVQGFADVRGKADANKSLSFSRAAAVRKYLVDGGISAERFVVDGFGSDAAYLLCKDNKEECHAQNRRIEVVKYLCKKPKPSDGTKTTGETK